MMEKTVFTLKNAGFDTGMKTKHTVPVNCSILMLSDNDNDGNDQSSYDNSSSDDLHYGK